MPSNSPSEFAELTDHLDALGVTEGDNICVHSRLLSFGKLKCGVDSIYDVVRNAIGPSGTIAVPTFTFNLTEQDVFDAANTPSYGMGALSEFVRMLPLSRRSSSAIHSYAAVGPLAGTIASAAPSRSVGMGSSFDVMLRNEFKLLLLGCTYTEGATAVHHFEAERGVSYREWVTLDRRVREGATVHAL